MSRKKTLLHIFLIIALACLLSAGVTANFSEGNHLLESLHSNEDTPKIVKALGGNTEFPECPPDLSQAKPSRIVMQVIDNTFHKWKEYDLDEPGRICVVLIEPEYRRLDAQEKTELLEASSKWIEQQPDLDQGYSLSPSDPRLDLPSIPMPYISDHPLELQEFTLEVFDQDDRVRVSSESSQTYPHNTIGYIESSFPNARLRASGFLIAPHTILTNAHVVYNENYGGYLNSMIFTPGQYQASSSATVQRPYGSREAFKVEANPGYLEIWEQSYGWEMAEQDYAAAFILDPFDGIDTYMPLEFNTLYSILETAGYPGIVQVEETYAQWFASGFYYGHSELILAYSISSSQGQSGSPVWADYNDKKRIIAIHSFSSAYFKGGPRLVDENINLIKEWMKWDPGKNKEKPAWQRIASNTSPALALDNNILAASFEERGVWLYDNNWHQVSTKTAQNLAFNNGTLAASFEKDGVFLYENEQWQKIALTTAKDLAFDNNGTLAASFDKLGLWLYQNNQWEKIASTAAENLAFDNNGTLAASFDKLGVWLYQNGQWQNIASTTAENLAFDNNGTLAASFDKLGVWLYQNGQWQKIAISRAQGMAAYNNTFIVSFNTFGVWYYLSN